eukprot:Skav223242  [mRNA]  locus=scaffold2231:421011:421604:+ [translate_table: standard]
MNSPLFLLLSFFHCLHVDTVEMTCDTEDFVAMQMAMLSATTTPTTTTTKKTTTTLSAPQHTVKFKAKGGELWPFLAKTFEDARKQATSQLRMKGWLKADGTCEEDCMSAASDYSCCFQFFLAGTALSKTEQTSLGNVPEVGTSLEVVFKAEENLDSEVVNFVRTSGLSADQQQASLKNLEDTWLGFVENFLAVGCSF